MKQIYKKCKRQFYFYCAWIFSKLVLLLPYKFCVGFVAKNLGICAYYVVGDARRKARKNLTMCFPEKSSQEIEDIIKKIFINESKNFFEVLSVPKLSQEFIDSIVTVTPEQKEIYDKVLSKKKGLLNVGAHFGNWEFSGLAVAKHYKLNVIAKKIYIDGLNDMLVKYRENMRETVILRSEPSSARKMIRALKHNEAIAMLIDQDTSVQSVFVDFFGKPASTPLGLASLALKLGTPVMVTLDKRLPNDKHVLMVSGEIFPDASTGDFDTDVKNFTQKLTKELEKHIRQNPEQWVWFHERWKTKQQ